MIFYSVSIRCIGEHYMNLMKKYYEIITKLMEDIIRDESEKIGKACEIIAESLINDGIIHVFGAGHSAMVGEELFYRAGGLVPVYPLLGSDINLSSGAFRSTMMESVKGYGEIIVKDHGVSENDVVIIVSTSGVNQFPVEVAIYSKQVGAKTIGITSIEYSRSLKPKNTFGKHLFEVVDVAIDNHVPRGDAILEIEGIEVKVSPVSTILNSFIVNSIVAGVVEKMVSKNIKPPIWISAHLPGAMDWNRALALKYRSRIPYLR